MLHAPLRPILAALLLVLGSGCWLFNDDAGTWFSPANFEYPDSPVVLLLGEEIDPLLPVHNPLFGKQFSAASLPPGLQIDPDDGAITGTPTEELSGQNYSIKLTATFEGQELVDLAILHIEVVGSPPTALAYAPNPAVLTLGEPAPPITPFSGVPATAFTIAPDLPAGLAIDASSGVIGGTPAELSASTSYEVVASNPFGSTVAHVEIEVVDEPPPAVVDGTRALFVACADGTLQTLRRVQALGRFRQRDVRAQDAPLLASAAAPDGASLYTLDEAGRIRLHAVDPESGVPGEGDAQAELPGATALAVTPSGQRVVVLTDTSLATYTRTSDGALAPDDLQPLLGGRRLELDPVSGVAYVLTSGAVELVAFRTEPTLLPLGEPLQPIGFPDELVVDPDGGRLYALDVEASQVVGYALSSAADVEAGSALAAPLNWIEVLDPTTYDLALLRDGSTRSLCVASRPGAAGALARVLSYPVDADSGELASLASTLALGPTIGRLEAGARDRVLFATAPERHELFVLEPAGSPHALAIGDLQRTRDAARALAPLPGPPVPEVSRTVFTACADDDTLWVHGLAAGAGAISTEPLFPHPTGRRPLDLAVSPRGDRVLVACDLDGTIASFDVQPGTGQLTSSSIPATPIGFNAPAVEIDATGRYAVALTEFRVRAFEIDPTSGALVPTGEALLADTIGRTLTLDPSGRWVVVSTTNGALALFELDPIDGGLTSRGSYATGATGRVAFGPEGRHLYQTESDVDTVLAFRFDPTADLVIAPLSPAAIATGGAPVALAVHPGGGSAYALNGIDASIAALDRDRLTGALSPGQPAAPVGVGPTSLVLTVDGAGLLVGFDQAPLGSLASFDVQQSLDPAATSTATVGAHPSALAVDLGVLP